MLGAAKTNSRPGALLQTICACRAPAVEVVLRSRHSKLQVHENKLPPRPPPAGKGLFRGAIALNPM
eukprot:12605838-Alexandrium_andersonii.AAC.1